MRPFWPFGIALIAFPVARLAAQERPVLPGEILRAEDRRPLGGPELELLLRGLTSREAPVRERAARAVGRMERPALAERLMPLLADPSTDVRAAGAEALAQAAQGFRGDTSLARRGAGWPAIARALGERSATEGNPRVLGMLALSLGRLPYIAPEEVRIAAERLVSLSRRVSDAEGPLLDVSRGMETLVRATARRSPPETALLARLGELARRETGDPRVRRRALAALLGVRAVDSATRESASRSPDMESRRLAALAGARLTDDAIPSVRLEALRVLARAGGAAACEHLRRAADDPAPAVALTGIDLLGTACAGDSVAVRLLEELSGAPGGNWHRRAHATVSLAGAAPARAGPAVAAAAEALTWQARMYAARAAALRRDTVTLRRLARDSAPNVAEAAIAGLKDLAGHSADALYLAALAVPDYQLVLTAAGALGGSPDRGAAAPALLAALDRITTERRETSRDPRVALLTRLHQLGDSALGSRLRGYLRDFDPVVAESAAAMLSEWSGSPVRPQPRRLEPAPVSLAEADSLRGKLLRFTMASGRSFDVELLVDQAPVTVARIAALARRGYYDGRTVHRVVPNFVIQGGSPGANEYAGDSLFIRDELGALSHERGTLGVSTRGRDTGDGQFFVNLVDNLRLDYEYTVWGRVVSGMEVVDVIEEGDTIHRVRIRAR